MVDRLETKKLRLARVKYYDVEHNGAELDDLNAYAFLYPINDKYINLFDPVEELPILDRSLYSNTTSNGEDYGNKLYHISGILRDGPCYVMDLVDCRQLFGTDSISMEQLKRFMINSEKFFVDRPSIMDYKEMNKKQKRKYLAKIMNDQNMMEKLKSFMASHEKGAKYIK